LEEEGLHPETRRGGVRSEKGTSKVAVVLDEGKAVSDARPCSPEEAQHVTPNAGDDIPARDIFEPPLWPVVETRQ